MRFAVGLGALIVTLLPVFVQAQTRFEGLLRNPQLRTMPSGSQAMARERAETPGKLAEAALQIGAVEERLESMAARLRATGYTSEQLIENLSAVSARLESGALARDSAELNHYRSEVATLKPLVVELVATLDGYIQDSLDLALAQGIYSVRNELASAPRLMRKPDVRSLYSQLNRQIESYLANKDQYGKGNDTLRVQAFNGFFRTLKRLYVTMDHPFLSRTRQASRSLLRLVRSAAWVAARPRFALTMANTLATVLRNPQPVGNKNPVVAQVMHATRELSRQLGIEVNVIGLENLEFSEASEDGKDVYILTPSHRDFINDQIGISFLNSPSGHGFNADDAAPFAAAHVYPAFIVKRLNENAGFIPVGKKAEIKPLDKAKLIVQSTEIRNFINYPQGRLPEGLGATSGARERFYSEGGTISAYESLGYRVHLIPVVMPVNAKLFGGRTLTRTEGLTVYVGPQFRDKPRKLLEELAGEDAVGVIMRYGLMENLVTNDELLWGQVRATRLNEALNEYLFGANPCVARVLGQASSQ